MTEPTNVLLVMSDEHRPGVLGCAGHPLVQTPTIDRLARSGTRFSNAYCSSPLCVPSRASFATGRYVHETGHWDNATPYDGDPRSWGHHFAERGVGVTTVGKLDFEPGADDGFEDQRLATHREIPDVYGLHRDPPLPREDARERIRNAGSADEPWYEAREEAKTREAIEFLESRGPDSNINEPWVLWVNYILPHFPLVAATEYYEQYPLEDIDLPVGYTDYDAHPILDELREHFDGADLDEATLRRTRAAYYGLCTALDGYLERLLDALDRLGLADDTLVIYASDHGEMLGDHGLWWKSCLYDPSVGVPLVVRGPEVEENVVYDGAASLLDLVPTMAGALGIESDPDWRGRSLLPVVRGEQEVDPERAVFSEYHAHGTSRGAFMLRAGRFKYVCYPDKPDQLFDIEEDSDERENLATDPAFREVRNEFERRLRERVDPERVDQRARTDQRERLAELDTDS